MPSTRRLIAHTTYTPEIVLQILKIPLSLVQFAIDTKNKLKVITSAVFLVSFFNHSEDLIFFVQMDCLEAFNRIKRFIIP